MTNKKNSESIPEDWKDLHSVFEQFLNEAPAFVAILTGKDHTITYHNPLFHELMGPARELISKPFGEAIPEAAEQGFIEILDNVYRTGKLFKGTDIPAQIEQEDGSSKDYFFDFIYKPFYDKKQDAYGIFIHGVDVTDQVKARKKAEAENLNSSNLIHQTSIGIVQSDLDGRILFANPHFCNMLGYQLHELKLKTIKEITNEDDHADNIRLFRDLLENGEPFNLQKSYKRKDGFLKPAFVNVSLIKDADEEPYATLAVVQELSSKEEEEQRYVEQNLLYRTFAEAMPQMAFVADTDGNIIYFNKRWYDYVAGLEDTEGWGWKDKPIHHPEDLDRTIKRWSNSLKTGESYEIEYRLKRYDGVYRWHLGRAEPVHNTDGSIRLWLGTNTDIHAQKMAEEALRKSEEYNRTLIESSPDCIKILDQQGNLQSINGNGLEMLEIDDFNMYKGKPWIHFWPEEYRAAAKEAVDQALQGETGHFRGFSKTNKGTTKWWDVMISPVRSGDNQIERLVCVSRDITMIKLLEQQKDDFIGIASHELKTPVTSIKGYAQVLLDIMDLNPATERILYKMDKQLDKLTRLITDLLDITKIEQGKLAFHKEEFVLNHLITEIADDVQDLTDHEIIHSCDQEIRVRADRERIGQVLTNYITNAIKYSPKGKRVEINAGVSGEKVVVMVQDHGIGLADIEKTKVFNRFYRVEGKGYETFPGLGLGLFIASEIIHRHNGEVWVESTKGEGSKFFFSLPLSF